MMANVEIIKFQNEMIQSIKQEMRAEGDRHQDNCNLNKVVRWVIWNCLSKRHIHWKTLLFLLLMIND